MKLIIASDHVGFPLKQAIIEHLVAHDVDVTDAGPYSGDTSVDYPDFAQTVGRAVASGEADQGLLVCGTGLGMSMAANKVPGVRAALCHDPYTAHQARAHNDANVLCLGGWIVSPQRMAGILEEWLNTEFEHGRHTARLAKLENGANSAQPARGGQP